MRSSRSSLFNDARQSLNETQQSTLHEFADKGLTAAHFSNRSWFNDFYHNRAFEMLVVKKQQSFDEAFATLDQLDKDQARGVLLGLSHDEVAGLSRVQIDAYLKYGLPPSDSEGLGYYQLQTLLAFRDRGLTAKDLRGQDWLNSYQHHSALVYLVNIQKQSYANAFQALSKLNAKEAEAIRYGLQRDEIEGLAKHSLSALIASRKHAGLNTRAQIIGLSESQLNVVSHLYHFGLTSQHARQLPKKISYVFSNALSRLIKERGIPVTKLLPLIDGLDAAQVEALANGLQRADVLGLTKYQVKALADCRTIKNGLCADHFRGHKWFNSDEHKDALRHMLNWGKFTVKEAMAELDGSTGPQAKEISRGKKRDDIVGLSKWQLAALDNNYLRISGLQGRHLRGKDWFNSCSHVDALEHFMKKNRMPIADALNRIDGLSSRQVHLMRTDDVSRDVILSLTDTQLEIIENQYKYGIFGSTDALLPATWLKTPEQAALLKQVCGKVHNTSSALAIVKKASDEDKVTTVLQKLKDGEITANDLRQLDSNTSRSTSSTDADEPRARDCVMM